MNEEAVIGIDPFTGLPYLRYEKIHNTGGGGGISDLSTFTTDDLSQGSNNLYSQWARNTYNATLWLQPKTATDGLVIGQPPDATIFNTFSGISAIFNGDIGNTNQGINFYGVFSYGSSFLPLGGAYVSGNAGGTAALPTQLASNGFMGLHAFSGFDGSSWTTSNANHTVPGLYGVAIGQPTAGTVDGHYFLGSVSYKMLGFRSDTNAIYLNFNNLTATTTIGSAAGTAVTVDGTTGTTAFPFGISTGATPSTTGDIRLTNSGIIKSRNAANSADINLLYLDTSNQTHIDSGLATYIYANGTLNWQVLSTQTRSTMPLLLNYTSGSLGTNEKFRVTDVTTVDSLANVQIGASATTAKPLILQGKASQTANLQEWQNSAGTVLAEIFANGQLAITSSGGGISNGTTNVYGARQSINTVANGNIGLVIRAAGPSQTADLQEWQASAGTPLAYIDSAGLGGFAGLNITDAKNIVLGSTTGTKIGTTGGGSGQKLAFWGSTPIVQPVLATGAGRTVDEVITVLQNLGLVRQS